MPASLSEASDTWIHSTEAPSCPQGKNCNSLPSATLALGLAHSGCSKKMLLGLTEKIYILIPMVNVMFEGLSRK